MNDQLGFRVSHMHLGTAANELERWGGQTIKFMISWPYTMHFTINLNLGSNFIAIEFKFGIFRNNVTFYIDFQNFPFSSVNHLNNNENVKLLLLIMQNTYIGWFLVTFVWTFENIWNPILISTLIYVQFHHIHCNTNYTSVNKW